MKKSVCCAALCATMFSGAVMAKDGFYYGASVAMNNLTTKVNVATTITVPTSMSINSETKSGDMLLGGDVVFGYQMPASNRWSVAFEVDASMHFGKLTMHDSSVTIGSSTLTGTEEEKYQYSVGAAIVPHWLLNTRTDLFFKVGLRRGHFKNTINTLVGNQAQEKEWRNGLELGFGTQLTLSESTDLVLDISRTHYQRKSLFTNLSEVTYKTTANVDKASLGLRWKSDWL